MSIKDMNYVTVEQVLALRAEAMNLERQRDQLAEALREMLNEMECMKREIGFRGNTLVVMDKTRAALKEMEGSI